MEVYSMENYKLDERRNIAPYEIVNSINTDYKQKYDHLVRTEKTKNKALSKEVRRCKRNSRFLAFRRLIFYAFLLWYFVTSFFLCGFAANRYVAYGVFGIIALMLTAAIVLFILAVFRLMYFRTVLMIVRPFILLAAWLMSTYLLSGSSVSSFLILILSIVFVFILNHAYATTRLKAKSQVVPFIISAVLIVLAILSVFGINFNERNHTLYVRDFSTRASVYETIDLPDGSIAQLKNVLITANDILAYKEKEVFKVVDTVKEGIPVIEVYERAFKGVTSVETVVLPESVYRLSEGAFAESEVHIVEMYAPEIYIHDGLEGSQIRLIKLLSDKATKIYLVNDSTLAENVTFGVPEDLVHECRALNPELADRIIAIQG